MRTELLERTIDFKLGTFACRNGCGANFTYREMTKHYDECPKGAFQCPDPNCTKKFEMDEMILHLRTAHQALLINGDEWTSTGRNFFASLELSDILKSSSAAVIASHNLHSSLYTDVLADPAHTHLGVSQMKQRIYTMSTTSRREENIQKDHM